MLLGVKHLMRKPCRGEHARQQLRQFNRSCAHKNGLTPAMAFADIFNRCFVFFFGGFVNPIELVVALTDFVGGNDDGF